MPTLPGKRNLARQVNRHRQKQRPENPKDLEFVIQEEHIPDGFLKEDVVIDGKRHLILATDDMLNLLKRARSWFMDATFYVVSAPFKQLFSIHAFVKHGTSRKQVPLVFAIMSARRASDYRAVLEAIIQLLPYKSVTDVTADFEIAMWKAVRELFPQVQMSGCLFHFTQAINRKIQEIGLSVAYKKDVGTRATCRRLMALPLLPNEHIVPIFCRLEQELDVDTPEKILKMFRYVRLTWIEGHSFTPKDWSVFQKQVRTNNDVEGWHTRLNQKGQRGQLPLYLLCHLLHKEAQMAQLSAEFVQREDPQREQRKGYKHCTDTLNKYWDEYANNQRTALALLDAGSHIIKPLQNVEPRPEEEAGDPAEEED